MKKECSDKESPEMRESSLLRKLCKSLEHHHTGLELLKIVHKVDSSAIPLRLINSVLQVAGSYLNLYLTARLIDTLLAGRYPEGLAWAGCLVLTGLLLGAIAQLVEKAYAKSSAVPLPFPL